MIDVSGYWHQTIQISVNQAKGKSVMRVAFIFMASFGVLNFFNVECRAQQTPPPDVPVVNESLANDKQDAVQVVTEEVQIGFAAMDDKERFVIGVEKEDVGITEDGVPQTITSIRRVPADVMLLLDVGAGVLPMAKDIRVVRRLAQEVMASLPEGERVSVVQFAERPEVLRDWTTDKAEVEQVLETKLLSGRQARFSDAVLFAVRGFETQPTINRHLVIISDGVESAASAARRAEAWRACARANVTIHFLSLTKFAVEAVKGKTKLMRPRELRADVMGTEERERVRQTFPPYGGGRPPIMYQMKTQPGGVTVNLDFKQRRLLKDYEAATRQSETELAKQITEDAGGALHTPQTADEMLDASGKIAREIGAQYIITYRPKRPFAESPAGEARRIFVASRRVGLHLSARRKYVGLR
ncbi:MAG: VWA domain-containing protein [Pyrinomonadaceae bacterium MAG19_C2-C3]|nr:VWA domain-containing protein [Pyrinomonadaceae bacterium MAG19_C2-C3]